MNIVLKLKKIFFPIYVFFLKIYLLPQRIYFYLQNKSEINIINKSLDKYDGVVGVYNLNVYKEPFSVGEFCYFIFFYRYFAVSNKRVSLYFIKRDKYNNNFKRSLSLKKEEQFIKWYFQISKILIGKKLIEIDYISWNKFKKKNFQNMYMPYRNMVMKQKQIREFFVAMLNPLLKNKPKNFLKNFLLNKKTLHKYHSNKFPKNKYVTWHIRKSKTWTPERNLEERDILTVYQSIKKRFKNMKIVIISDRYGCNFVKRLDKKFNLKLFYCKDLGASFKDMSSSLLSDFHLVLNSQCFLAFKGGGLICAAEFSTTPFFCAWTLGLKNQLKNDRFVDINKTQIWHKKNQVWINSKHIESFIESIKTYKI